MISGSETIPNNRPKNSSFPAGINILVLVDVLLEFFMNDKKLQQPYPLYHE